MTARGRLPHTATRSPRRPQPTAARPGSLGCGAPDGAATGMTSEAADRATGPLAGASVTFARHPAHLAGRPRDGAHARIRVRRHGCSPRIRARRWRLRGSRRSARLAGHCRRRSGGWCSARWICRKKAPSPAPTPYPSGRRRRATRRAAGRSADRAVRGLAAAHEPGDAGHAARPRVIPALRTAGAIRRAGPRIAACRPAAGAPSRMDRHGRHANGQHALCAANGQHALCAMETLDRDRTGPAGRRGLRPRSSCRGC